MDPPMQERIRKCFVGRCASAELFCPVCGKEAVARNSSGEVDHDAIAALHKAEHLMAKQQKLELRALLESHDVHGKSTQAAPCSRLDGDFVVIYNVEECLEMDFDDILSFGN